MAASAKTWIGLAAFAAVLMVVAGWFLLVSPAMTAAADTREATAAEVDRTAVLTAQLDALIEQSAHLDEYRAELAELTSQIPQTAAMSDFRKAVADAADTAGVTVLTVTAGAAQAIPTPVAVPADPTATAEDAASETAQAETTEAETATDGSAQATPAPAAAATTGVIGVPISVTVVGSYADSLAFLAAVQTGLDRLVLVGGVDLVSQVEAAATGGRPATHDGDLELTIDGFVMVLPVTEANAAVEPAAETEPGPGQLPESQRNPFAPVG